jgi:hypothetical protein
MTTNEPLDGIQARIEDLQNTIAEKEEQIRDRARQLKEDLQTGLSPEAIVRKHPLETAGAVLAVGFMVGRAMKPSSAKKHPEPVAQTIQHHAPSRSLMGSIGIDILRSVKDLGFTYLQRYLDRKIRQ